jgi:aminoglycoside phosphotransferase family enzyme
MLSSIMVTIEEKVRFLSEPAAYGPHALDVGVNETHMSWLFLTPERVYKLKKPVRYPFLDFTALKRRKFFCEEELRLNRRLAAETYLRVLPLRQDREGKLAIDGPGRIVDWLVEMRRLREEDTLESHLRSGRATLADIEKTAHLLAEFYAGLRPEAEDGMAYLKHLREEQVINRDILENPALEIAQAAGAALDAVDLGLAEFSPLITERIRSGIVVEGHGDLRPEHIFLGDPVQVIDCLEFNRSMRIIDPHDEVNYLALECEMLGAGWARPLLSSILVQRIGNAPPPGLLALYGGFRALLRARLSIAHLLEHPVRKPHKWRPLALRYLEAAHRLCVSQQALRDPPEARSRRDA